MTPPEGGGPTALRLKPGVIRRQAMRVALVVTLAMTQAAFLGAGRSSAHALISYITLSAAATGSVVTIQADIHYPDNDPVVGESVVGVAYSRTTSTTVVLRPTPDAATPGRWKGTLELAPGSWQVEVDAVSKTKGLQSIGFTVTPGQALTDVVSPSPLPTTVVVPNAPAVGDDNLRSAPNTRSPPLALGTAILCVLVACLIPLWFLRKRKSDDDPVAAGLPH